MPMTDEQKREWAEAAREAFFGGLRKETSTPIGDGITAAVEAVAPLIRRAALEEAAGLFEADADMHAADAADTPLYDAIGRRHALQRNAEAAENAKRIRALIDAEGSDA